LKLSGFGCSALWVGSILSRAELASRYLVIVQARRILAARGVAPDFSHLLADLPLADAASDAEVSVAECRVRLRALRAVLSDLPRHALRLLRRIERPAAGAVIGVQDKPRPMKRRADSLRILRIAKNRIERPPDIGQLLR